MPFEMVEGIEVCVCGGRGERGAGGGPPGATASVKGGLEHISQRR